MYLHYPLLLSLSLRVISSFWFQGKVKRKIQRQNIYTNINQREVKNKTKKEVLILEGESGDGVEGDFLFFGQFDVE